MDIEERSYQRHQARLRRLCGTPFVFLTTSRWAGRLCGSGTRARVPTCSRRRSQDR